MSRLFLIIGIILVPALLLASDRSPQAVDRGLSLVEKDKDTRKRIALVIGNSFYNSSPLRNPVNDAHAIASTLRRLGFDVDVQTNLGRDRMEEAIERFGSRLAAGGVGLFYYAGHGVQVAGNNYLIPVDAKINAENEIRYKALDAGILLAKMEQAKSDVNIVIMDACRDNPFSRNFRSSVRGLATMDAPSGTIIAYATAPGKTAADGVGDNGIYTEELLKYIEKPDLNLEGVFKQVRKAVITRTSGLQTPWESSSLTGEFRFQLPAGSPEATVPVPGPKTVGVEDPEVDGLLTIQNGFFADNRTGLVWDGSGNVAKGFISFGQAMDHTLEMNELQYAGFNDWRVPSRKELHTLFNSLKTQAKRKPDEKIISSYIKEYQRWQYWTKDRAGDYAPAAGTAGAYTYDLESGTIGIQRMSSSFPVLYVRGKMKKNIDDGMPVIDFVDTAAIPR